MTELQQRALMIVAEHGPIKPREFARFMWPDSEAWSHHTKCGNHGVTTGGGMNMAGGMYLGKLRQKKWVDYYHREVGGKLVYRGFIITQIGSLALKGEGARLVL